VLAIEENNNHNDVSPHFKSMKFRKVVENPIVYHKSRICKFLSHNDRIALFATSKRFSQDVVDLYLEIVEEKTAEIIAYVEGYAPFFQTTSIM